MPLLDGRDTASLDAAVRALARGELVAFPTETVYGLGARADDDAAVAGIFAAKGRPSEHPLIVHVLDADGAGHFGDLRGETAERLMSRFWPGPLTVVVPRRQGVAAAAAGGQDSIGLRAPAHPLARALLARAGAAGVPGVAAPSANRFGRVSPTTAAHVRQEFGDALIVLDGGPCHVGIESTIIDCRADPPTLLRPGWVSRDAAEQALGRALAEPGASAPRAPGRLTSHYAPSAPVRLFDAPALHAAWKALDVGARVEVAVYSRDAPAGGAARHRQMPADAAGVAYELFAVLRAFDDAGVRQIWVERPPTGPAWDGVNDRLRRAAA